MNNGIWLRHDYCGSIGAANPSASKTFVHEVGHWLNLPNTWGSLASNCSSDDGVTDTPAQLVPSGVIITKQHADRYPT